MKELICVKTYPNRIDAELAKALLEENGIKAMILGDDVGGAYPALLWGAGGARLLVQEKNKEKAIFLLGK